MNAGGNDDAALAHRPQARGHQRPDGGEEDRRIELFGRRFVRATNPCRTELARKVLGDRVARAGEGMDALALVDSDLRDDMCGGAEAIKADRLAGARHAVGAVTDEAGAEQRGRFRVAVLLRQVEAVAPVGDDIVGIAAVDVTAGEMRRVAEILQARKAVAAVAAGPAEPGHADARADGKIAHPIAQGRHAADDLVARDDRITRLRQFAVGDVQVGAADAAGKDANQNLAGSGRRLRPVDEPQGLARPIEHHRAHGRISA